MRKIPISEDGFFFNRGFTPEDRDLYKDNKDDFEKMLNDQPSSFWLKFVISFRSAIHKEGLVPWKDERRVYCEECFIYIHDLLMAEKALRKQKMQEFFSVVVSAKLYNTLGTSHNIPPEKLWESALKPNLEKLFGSVTDIPKKICIFHIYERFAGALVECYKCWKTAETVKSYESMTWKPPIQWKNISRIKRVYLFERHLKQKWGKRLEQLTGLPIKDIVWWHEFQKLKIVEDSQNLPKCHDRNPFASDIPVHYPWDENDDDDDNDGEEDNDDDTSDVESISDGIYFDNRSASESGDDSDDFPPWIYMHRISPLDYFVGRMIVECAVEAMINEARFWNRSSNVRRAPRTGQDLRKCRHCNITEPTFGVYKFCKKCLDTKSVDPKVYCGHSCQAADWRLQHRQEHKQIKKSTR